MLTYYSLELVLQTEIKRKQKLINWQNVSRP